MKFDELSNEEIVFIHLMVEDKLETLNEVLDKGGITYIMDSPLGKIELFGKFSEKELEDLREGVKYKLAKAITKKLEPIYDIIADTESGKEVIDKVRNSLFPKIEDDEED